MKFKFSAVLFVAAFLVGCNDHGSVSESASVVPSPRAMGAAMPAPAPIARMQSDAVADGQGGDQAIEQRRIAETQNWRYEIPASQLEEVWHTHHALCESLGNDCEILQANISSGLPGQGARNAVLDMRVDRKVFPDFLDSLNKSSEPPIEKNVAREDRTLQWVDLQARKANTEELRDRLKAMIARHEGESLSDLLALERELNRVQSTLDSMEAQTRVLAQETERVRMTFRYSSAPQTVVDDLWRPIREAWHRMGMTFTRNAASVMLFVASALPWLIVLIPAWWVLRRVIRAMASRVGGIFRRKPVR